MANYCRGTQLHFEYENHAVNSLYLVQYEFIAKSTGNLCKRYFDAVKGGTRTANAPWTITINKKKRNKVKNGKRKNKKV